MTNSPLHAGGPTELLTLIEPCGQGDLIDWDAEFGNRADGTKLESRHAIFAHADYVHHRRCHRGNGPFENQAVWFDRQRHPFHPQGWTDNADCCRQPQCVPVELAARRRSRWSQKCLIPSNENCRSRLRSAAVSFIRLDAPYDVLRVRHFDRPANLAQPIGGLSKAEIPSSHAHDLRGGA